MNFNQMKSKAENIVKKNTKLIEQKQNEINILNEEMKESKKILREFEKLQAVFEGNSTTTTKNLVEEKQENTDANNYFLEEENYE